MLHPVRWLVPALLAGWLLTAGPALPQDDKDKKAAETAYGVKDKAGLFGEEAKRIAELECAYIHQRFKKDLLVETFASAPESIKDVKLQDAEAKRKFFRDWAIDRAKAAKLDGVIVLICNNPKYVEALASSPTERFSAAGATTLAQKIIDRLKADQKDDALLDAAAFVRQTMASHARAGKASSAEGVK